MNKQAVYEHLKQHPGAYAAARSFAARLVAKDAGAAAELATLKAKCKAGDPKACHAIRAVCVVVKFEHPGSNIFAGGLPAIASAGGKVIKVALTPVAWTLKSGGSAFHWAGSQLRKLSHVI